MLTKIAGTQQNSKTTNLNENLTGTDHMRDLSVNGS
jgi:hypothetical protein